MTWIRSLAAVLAGFAVVVVIVMTMVWVQGLLFPAAYGPGVAGSPADSMILVNVLYSAVAAVAGGWVTGRLADRLPLVHAGLLGLVMVFMGAAGGDGTPEAWPTWYARTLTVLPALTLVGGWIARRASPRRPS